MKRFVTLIAAALLATVALASGTTATVSWLAPTTYNDGTPVGASDIASYTITWVGSGAKTSGTLVVNAPALSTTVPVACGSASFTVTATASATAVYAGTSAASSPPATYATGVTCSLNPPTGVQAK